jgi:hypothetical protein
VAIDNLRALLPEEISDESAYHLVNFFINLTVELESYYFAQMRRHINDSKPGKLSEYYQNKIL